VTLAGNMRKRILVVGTGAIGIVIASELTRNPEIKEIRLADINLQRAEQIRDWLHACIRAKTVMGVEGSIYVYITWLHDYYGRYLYRIIRMAYDVEKRNKFLV